MSNTYRRQSYRDKEQLEARRALDEALQKIELEEQILDSEDEVVDWPDVMPEDLPDFH